MAEGSLLEQSNNLTVYKRSIKEAQFYRHLAKPSQGISRRVPTSHGGRECSDFLWMTLECLLIEVNIFHSKILHIAFVTDVCLYPI